MFINIYILSSASHLRENIESDSVIVAEVPKMSIS